MTGAAPLLHTLIARLTEVATTSVRDESSSLLNISKNHTKKELIFPLENVLKKNVALVLVYSNISETKVWSMDRFTQPTKDVHCVEVG